MNPAKTCNREGKDAMGDFVLNRMDLSHYRLLREHVAGLDNEISLLESELEELEKYSISIGCPLTGMPTGNELKDKIADFIITLEKDRERLLTALQLLIAERNAVKYKLHKIRAAVNKFPNKQLREVIRWYYFDGKSAIEIAKKKYWSRDTVYKRIDRFFELAELYSCGKNKVPRRM